MGDREGFSIGDGIRAHNASHIERRQKPSASSARSRLGDRAQRRVDRVTRIKCGFDDLFLVLLGIEALTLFLLFTGSQIRTARQSLHKSPGRSSRKKRWPSRSHHSQ